MSVAGRLLLALAVIVPLIALGAPPVRADGDGGSETINVTIPASAKVGCSEGGVSLGNQPRVHRGERLHCRATGFAAHEQVTITLHSTVRDLGPVSADRQGTATYDLTVPDDLAFGLHAMTFTGATSGAVASYRFVVVGGHSAASAGGGGSGSASGSASGGGSGGASGGGSLATTGVAILALLAGAVVLITVGVFAAAAGRRQQAEQA